MTISKNMDDIHTVYIGYYIRNDKILCISTDKELVVSYLENHRGLNSDTYYIEKRKLSDTEILIKYEYYVISEFNDYYIPYIDQCIISMSTNSLYNDIINIMNELKKITILSSNIKKITKNECSTLVDAIKVLESFAKRPKILNKLNKEYKLSHSILFCDIDQYFMKVNLFYEMKDWDMSFNNALSDD